MKTLGISVLTVVMMMSSMAVADDTLTDNFNAGILANRWDVFQNNASGVPWTIAAPDGQGRLAISKAEDNDPSQLAISGGVASRFSLEGNFTISVDFSLPYFPVGNNPGWNDAVLACLFGGSDYFSTFRISSGWNEQYSGCSASGFGGFGQGPDSTVDGRLVMTRSGSTVSGWIDRGSGPVLLGSQTSSRFLGSVAVELFAAQYASGNERPTNAMDIRFDNFTATADTIVPEPATSTTTPVAIFSDSTFRPQDWSVTTMVLGPGGNASISQETQGGNGGAYRAYSHTVNTPTASEESYLSVFHFRNDAIYDPSILGPISSIGYSEDTIVSGGAGDIGAGLAIMQGGRFFVGGYRIDSGQPYWANHSCSSLAAEDFKVWVPGVGFDTSAHPDFSASGSPITFGFLRANSGDAGLWGYSVSGGTDNWTVTVIPEPASLSLLALASLALLRRKKTTRI
jgi:hypothetical protein